MRAMLELASNYGQGPLQIKLIAERQDISAKYLEQLIFILKSAGFVNSIRGAKGEYVLARLPEQILLNDIFGALEGSSVTVECVEDSEFCNRVADCATRKVWQEVQEAIESVLKSQTLKDLLDRTKDKEKLCDSIQNGNEGK
jgi:Rrf2 family protein